MILYEDLLAAMKGSKPERDAAIRKLAGDKSLQSKVRAMVKAKGGNQEDATMVYSDTVVAFLKSVMTKKQITLSLSLESYLLGIARHKWYDLLKSRNNKIDSTDLDDIDPPKQEADQYNLLRRTEKWEMLQKVLSVIAGRCKEVLMLWAAGHSMKEVAKELQYKSDGMARKKKSECMKELLTYLYNHPKVKEQLR